MPRILITFAKLSACPILALVCLVLVGCEVQAQGSSWHWEEKWELKTEWTNLVEYVWNDEAPQYDSTWHLVRRKVYHPCQPETVYFPDTVYKWVDSEDKVVALNPITRYDTTYQMPEGHWVKIGVWTSCRPEDDTTVWSHYGCFYFYDKRMWPPPDSVFILSKPGAVPSSLREE